MPRRRSARLRARTLLAGADLLPNDLWQLVFQFLPLARDVVRLRFVCRGFAKGTDNDPVHASLQARIGRLYGPKHGIRLNRWGDTLAMAHPERAWHGLYMQAFSDPARPAPPMKHKDLRVTRLDTASSIVGRSATLGLDIVSPEISRNHILVGILHSPRMVWEGYIGWVNVLGLNGVEILEGEDGEAGFVDHGDGFLVYPGMQIELVRGSNVCYRFDYL